MMSACRVVKLVSSGMLWLLVACGEDAVVPAASSSTGGDGDPSTGSTPSPPSTSSGVADSTSDERTSSDGSTGGISSSSGDEAESSGSSSTGEPNFADPRGYTLFAPLGSRYTYLMDADGLEVNRWESDTTPANSAYMRPNGHMMRVARDPNAMTKLVSGAGGIVQEFDWEGTVVWQYDHVGPDIIAHHDIEPLPNGNVLIVAYEMFSVDDAIAAGRDPAAIPPQGLWADFLVEVDPSTDQIVWEWHVWDHLVQEFEPLVDNYGVVGDHPELIDIGWVRPGSSARPDWTHINAVAYNESLDQIIVSPRTFSEVWIIDHSTTTLQAASGSGGNAGMGGDLLYRWGNPATYDAGDELDRELYFQHNPRWIEEGKPGGGRLLVFDNGDDDLRPWSRVLEVETPVLPDGTYSLEGPYFGPLDPISLYESPKSFYAAFISGADRLADGRTLVCDGPSGDLFEVDALGEVGWTHTVGSSTFRAERYEAHHPAWDGLSEEDLAPGEPVSVVLE